MTVVTSAAHAGGVGPSPYLCDTGCASDSLFNGLSFDYFYVEDFKDGMLNTPGVFQDGTGAPTAPGALTDSVDADDGVIDGSGLDGPRTVWSNHGRDGNT